MCFHRKRKRGNMKRLEYMTILRQKLVDGGLSNDEVNDALEFYEELFLDGGYENEEKTAQNLGDPEKLAAHILAENGSIVPVKPAEDMEDAYDNTNANAQQTPPPVNNGYDIAPDNRKKAIVIILLVTAIVWVPTLFGLAAGAFGLMIGILAAIFAIGVAGVGLLVSGVVSMFTAPPVGLLLFGTGMFLMGLSVLIMVPVVKGLTALVKKLINLIVKGFRKIMGTDNAKAVSSNG